MQPNLWTALRWLVGLTCLASLIASGIVQVAAGRWSWAVLPWALAVLLVLWWKVTLRRS